MSSQLSKEAVERRDRTLKHGAFLLTEYVRHVWKRRRVWKSSKEEVNVLTERDWERLKEQSGETRLEGILRENPMPCNTSPAKSLLGSWLWLFMIRQIPQLLVDLTLVDAVLVVPALGFRVWKELGLASGLTFLLCQSLMDGEKLR